MKIWGLGWAKTGTTTLGACMSSFGFRHMSTRLDLVDHLSVGNLTPIFQVADDHDSFEDWPWILLYKAVDKRYPGSKFILTLRDDSAWIQSYRNMLRRETPNSVLNRRRRVLYGFDVDVASDEELVARRRVHEECVRFYFRDREGDLLEVDWSRGDGWTKLCAFLRLPVPWLPFPHENKSMYDDEPPTQG
jgi:hypothetical protein